jgi:hypothetical protein
MNSIPSEREMEKSILLIVVSSIIILSVVVLVATTANMNKTMPSFKISEPRGEDDKHIHRALSKEEESKALNIMANDSQIRAILEKEKWEILCSGPWFEGKEKIGAALYIRFNESVWVEGTFTNPFNNKSYTAKMWVGGMHVLIDFRMNKVSGVDLGMGRPPREAPKVNESEKLALAERVARKHTLAESLGSNVTSYLATIYYNSEYPYGIAFFCFRSGQREAMIAVDLSKMEVVEKYTTFVGGFKK